MRKGSQLLDSSSLWGVKGENCNHYFLERLSTPLDQCTNREGVCTHEHSSAEAGLVKGTLVMLRGLVGMFTMPACLECPVGKRENAMPVLIVFPYLHALYSQVMRVFIQRRSSP